MFFYCMSKPKKDLNNNPNPSFALNFNSTQLSPNTAKPHLKSTPTQLNPNSTQLQLNFNINIFLTSTSTQPHFNLMFKSTSDSISTSMWLWHTSNPILLTLFYIIITPIHWKSLTVERILWIALLPMLQENIWAEVKTMCRPGSVHLHLKLNVLVLVLLMNRN